MYEYCFADIVLYPSQTHKLKLKNCQDDNPVHVQVQVMKVLVIRA